MWHTDFRIRNLQVCLLNTFLIQRLFGAFCLTLIMPVCWNWLIWDQKMNQTLWYCRFNLMENSMGVGGYILELLNVNGERILPLEFISSFLWEDTVKSDRIRIYPPFVFFSSFAKHDYFPRILFLLELNHCGCFKNVKLNWKLTYWWVVWITPQ